VRKPARRASSSAAETDSDEEQEETDSDEEQEEPEEEEEENEQEVAPEPTEATAAPNKAAKRKAEPEQQEEQEQENDDECTLCGDRGGFLISCSFCVRSFHFDCLDTESLLSLTVESSCDAWACPRKVCKVPSLRRPRHN
jgi:hypothetical protein